MIPLHNWQIVVLILYILLSYKENQIVIHFGYVYGGFMKLVNYKENQIVSRFGYVYQGFMKFANWSTQICKIKH